MKAIILAGGKGTRIRELSVDTPKPMIRLGGIPLVLHVTSILMRQGVTEFWICVGYKKDVFYDYFDETFERIEPKRSQGADLKRYLDIKSGCHFNILDTGPDTDTGGRLLRVADFLNNSEDFIFTYGDGLADIDLKALLNLHSKKKSFCTISTFRPRCQYGVIDVSEDGYIESFIEKPLLNVWSNCGYMVMSHEIFSSISGDSSNLEQEVLPALATEKRIAVYKHPGFFKAMDTYKEYLEFEEMLKNGGAKWLQ